MGTGLQTQDPEPRARWEAGTAFGGIFLAKLGRKSGDVPVSDLDDITDEKGERVVIISAPKTNSFRIFQKRVE